MPFPRLSFPMEQFSCEVRLMPVDVCGCYVRIIDESWRRNCAFLPDDDVALSTVCGIPLARWKNKIRPYLVKLFDLTAGVWFLPWMAAEFRRITEAVKLASEKGQKSASKRAEKAKSLKDNVFESTAVGTAVATPDEQTKDLREEKNKKEEKKVSPNVDTFQKSADADNKPKVLEFPVKEGPKAEKPEVPKKPKRCKPENDPAFAEFYDRYPRKSGRIGAAAAYRAIIDADKATAADLIIALDVNIAAWEDWPEEERRWIPGPTKWLTDECWKTTPISRNRHDERSDEPKFNNGTVAAAYRLYREGLG